MVLVINLSLHDGQSQPTIISIMISLASAAALPMDSGPACPYIDCIGVIWMKHGKSRTMAIASSDQTSSKHGSVALNRPAVFFDRDNTLTVDHGYTWKREDFAWIKGAPEALALFHKHEIPCFIVTNQGGIGRGYFTETQMREFNDLLCEQTELAGGLIRDVAFCPHHPKAISDNLLTPCTHRKPEPGMLISLASKWGVDLSASVMIGDRMSDVEAGKAAGCHAYLFDGTDLEALAHRVMAAHFTPISLDDAHG